MRGILLRTPHNYPSRYFGRVKYFATVPEVSEGDHYDGDFRMSPQGVVLGASGLLGGSLVKSCPDDLVAGPRVNVRNAADLARLEVTLCQFLDAVPVHTIINCIGRRQGTDEQLALANQLVPRTVVDVAKKRSLRVVHIGSAAELVSAREEADPKVARSILRYGESKKAGTREVLQYEGSVVARVHNLHGLPHQFSSGLHSLCLAIANTHGQREKPESPVVNVVRDYVHWPVALSELRLIWREKVSGVVEIRSGTRVSMRAIVEQLPSQLRSDLLPRLVQPDVLTDIPASDAHLQTPQSVELKAIELADEVLKCAHSPVSLWPVHFIIT